MEIGQEIIRDPRYLDIGDLPTGFAPYEDIGLKQIYLRPFEVRELPLLHLGAKARVGGIGHIIRAVNMVASCDVNCLTDGDFEFILTWLRKASYPESPMLVTWDCRKVNIVEKETRRFVRDTKFLTKTDMDLKGYEPEQCNTNNRTIVHDVRILVDTLDDDNLYIQHDDIDFPRVRTLLEFEEMVSEDPSVEQIAKIARWVKAGETVKEKIDILNNSDIDLYERIVDCQKEYEHGVRETMTMKCRECQNRVSHTAKPKMRSFFADNTESDIYDIQYNLMSEFGVAPDDSMPTKKLLYHHSCLAKDKQEEKERQAHARQQQKLNMKPKINVNR